MAFLVWLGERLARTPRVRQIRQERIWTPEGRLLGEGQDGPRLSLSEEKISHLPGWFFIEWLGERLARTPKARQIRRERIWTPEGRPQGEMQDASS